MGRDVGGGRDSAKDSTITGESIIGVVDACFGAGDTDFRRVGSVLTLTPEGGIYSCVISR
jgi:hypothetical protein